MAGASLAPWTASPPYVVDAIVKAVQLQPHDVFYDLGCGGHARVLIPLAQHICQRQNAADIQVQDPGPISNVSSCCCTREAAAGIRQNCCSNSSQQPNIQQHVQQCNCCDAVTEQYPPTAVSIINLQQQEQRLAVPGPAEVAMSSCPAHVASQNTQTLQQQQQQEHPQQLLQQQLPTGPRFVGVELDSAAAESAAAAVRSLPGLSLLAPKLLSELKPGCVVLTYLFRISGWEDRLQCCLPVTSGDPRRLDVSAVSKLFVYKV